MRSQLQQQWLLLLLPTTTLSLPYAVHAAPSARIQCRMDENCDDERIAVSCSNVTSYSPSSLSSACYCQLGNAYRCADLCQLGTRDAGQSCVTACPDYLPCTSGEAVNEIELAAIESPTSGSSLKPPAAVPSEAWYSTLVLLPIAVLVAYLLRRKNQIVGPTQETRPPVAIELHEMPSGLVPTVNRNIELEALVNAEDIE